jgi:hypothetical protein
MALTTNISNCVNWEELNTDANYPTTERIYFVTMVTDLGEITDTNYGEFYARIKVYALISGDDSITLDDIKRRIGLTTNVSNRTTAQFLKRMTELAQRDYYTATQNQIKAAYYNALVEAEKETVNA